jgi:hypothetical protein
VGRVNVLRFGQGRDPIDETVRDLMKSGWRDLGFADGGNGIRLRELDRTNPHVRVIVLSGADGVRWEDIGLLERSPVSPTDREVAAGLRTAVTGARGPVAVVELRRMSAAEH